VSQDPISVDYASDVPGSPGEVWSLIADPSSRPSWMTELRKVDATPGPVAVGDRFAGQSSILLHDFIGESKITDAEPGHLLAEEVVIGARFVSRWTVTPSSSGGSNVRHTIEVEFPSGPFSPIERWVLRRRLLRMQKSTMAKLATKFQLPDARGGE
jgi:uncharacterized protein YndB with AHSA1/START domain